ncbi:MAG: hypothetical protein AAGA56_10250 [Myxococcota bacterium]
MWARSWASLLGLSVLTACGASPSVGPTASPRGADPAVRTRVAGPDAAADGQQVAVDVGPGPSPSSALDEGADSEPPTDDEGPPPDDEIRGEPEIGDVDGSGDRRPPLAARGGGALWDIEGPAGPADGQGSGRSKAELTVEGDGYRLRLVSQRGDLEGRAVSALTKVRVAIDACGGTMWRGRKPLVYSVLWTSVHSAVSGPGFVDLELNAFARCVRRAFKRHFAPIHGRLAATRTDLSGRAEYELRLRQPHDGGWRAQ